MWEGMDGGGHGFVSMQSFSTKNQVRSLGQPSCKLAGPAHGACHAWACLRQPWQWLFTFFSSSPAIVFLASVHNRVYNFVGFHY
jgi:hypothetical protein